MEKMEKPLTDIKTFNILPVNEKAKELLIKTGIKPDSSSLYCVQLAKWGCEKGGIEVEDAIMETIDAMLIWGPERIANFLLIDIERMEYEPQGWQAAVQRPSELARVIIDDIEEKMHMHFPWYGSVE